MAEPTDVQPPSDVEGGMQAYQDVSAEIRERASQRSADPSPVEAWLREAASAHALNLAVATFAGYALATLIHRRPSRLAPVAPPRPRRTPDVPLTTYRGPSPDRDSRSSIRFR